MPAHLEPQAISVPLLALNQKAPKSSGPVGRLQSLAEGIVQKTREGQIQVQKRSAFRQLTLNTTGVNDSGTGGAGVPSPELIADFNGNLFEISSAAQPYAYEAQIPSWMSWPNLPVVNTLTRTSVFAGDAQIVAMDRAQVGSVWCYTWQQITSGTTGLAYVEFVDSSGVQIRIPTQIGSASTNGRIKVVADASRFWVFLDQGTTTITVRAYDSTGTFLATATADTLFAVGDVWDVVYDSSVGVCLARPLQTFGARLTILTYSAGIVVTGNSNVLIPWTQALGGGAFLTSYEADGHVYLYSVISGDGHTAHVSRLNPDASIAHDYTFDSVSYLAGLCNATGYVIPGSTDLVVTWSYLPTTGTSPTTGGTPINSLTFSQQVNFSGSVGTLHTQRSLQLASRAFRLGSRFYVVAYYASVPLSNAQQFSQTTFFLLDLSANTFQTVGRFEYGTAAQDWTFSGWNGTSAIGPGFWRLPSVIGGHVPLGFRAVTSVTQILETTATQGAVDPATGRFAPGPIVVTPVNVFTSTIGVVDIGFNSTFGRAVEYAGELLIPGAMAKNFSGGDFLEDNFNLAPEQGTLTWNGSAGSLTQNQTYQYVFVWEGTTKSGQRVRSAPSVAQTVLTGGSNGQVVVVVPTLRATDWVTNLAILSAYRTYIENGVMSTLHGKVTNDLAPLYNNPNADTITFTDTLSDAGAAAGEPLYSDGLTSPPIGYRYPAPPFSDGCIAENRAFVIGYDNAIWFSYEKVEGEQLSFNSVNRIVLPSGDRPVRILPLDVRMIILCANSIWAFNLSGLPDVNGNGTIPVPVVLPFSNGCTGPADLISDGIVYSSTTPGGPWLIGRDLTNTYIGGPVETDSLSNAPIAAVTDNEQRIHFVSATKDLVYDSVVNQWYTWTLPATAVRVGTFGGEVVFASTTRTWVYTPDLYVENSAGISTTTTLAPMAFGGVAGLMMVWKLQFLGEARGTHTMTITITYDDGTVAAETFVFTDAALRIPTGGAYRWEIDLANPECQAVSVSLVDTFQSGPSQGYTLENIGAEVGILPGTGKLSYSQRVRPE